MAAPNIVNVTNITGQNAYQYPIATWTPIVNNAAASGTVIKVNALYVANITAGATQCYIAFNRSGVWCQMAPNLTVPAYSTFDVLSKSIYLEEGDSLQLYAATPSQFQALCSYEVIS